MRSLNQNSSGVISVLALMAILVVMSIITTAVLEGTHRIPPLNQLITDILMQSRTGSTPTQTSSTSTPTTSNFVRTGLNGSVWQFTTSEEDLWMLNQSGQKLTLCLLVPNTNQCMDPKSTYKGVFPNPFYLWVQGDGDINGSTLHITLHPRAVNAILGDMVINATVSTDQRTMDGTKDVPELEKAVPVNAKEGFSTTSEKRNADRIFHANRIR